MRFRSITLYSLAGVFQALGSSGAAMLAPFFMKTHGYSVALAGIPLVVNGLGRISSDLLSGLLATYLSSGVLLIMAVSVALAASAVGTTFREVMPIFLGVWAVLGLTEAMFALSLRKIAFDQSAPGEQGRAQGQVAGAVGIGFAIGPMMAGLVGSRWGPNILFSFYALPQVVGLIFVIAAGGHRVSKPVKAGKAPLWRAGRELLRKPHFLAICLAIFQTFLFLIGVTRVAFPFLAVRRGLGLDRVGTIVGLSRFTDTGGRYIGGWLSDRIGTPRVILTGILVGVPMFLLEVYGTGFTTLLIPLALMTMGFGLTNVGSTTYALQSGGPASKGLGLGLARASNSAGTMVGPLVIGILIQGFGYEGGFLAMAVISFLAFLAVWFGFRRHDAEGL